MDKTLELYKCYSQRVEYIYESSKLVEIRKLLDFNMIFQITPNVRKCGARCKEIFTTIKHNKTEDDTTEGDDGERGEFFSRRWTDIHEVDPQDTSNEKFQNMQGQLPPKGCLWQNQGPNKY